MDWNRGTTLTLLAASALAEPCHAALAQARSETGSTAATVRVLVELRVASDGALEAGIADAQREVLARLAGTHVVVGRRYRSIPLLALEVDAGALARLEQMTDLVIRIVPDAPARTQ